MEVPVIIVLLLLPPYSNGLGSEEWWWWWGWSSPECQGRHQRSLQISQFWGNTSLAGLMGLNWVNFRIRRTVKCGQNYKVEMFQLSNSVWRNILFLLNFLTAFNVYDLCLVAAPTSLSPVIDRSVNNFIMKLITHFITDLWHFCTSVRTGEQLSGIFPDFIFIFLRRTQSNINSIAIPVSLWHSSIFLRTVHKAESRVCGEMDDL